MNKKTNKQPVRENPAIDPWIECDPNDFIPVDGWIPEESDFTFKTSKGLMLINVSEFYGLEPNANLDAFVMSTKRSYNSPKMRDHMTQYLNYFEKYYDTDKLLYTTYCKLKYLIDYEPGYTKEAFFYDIQRYILHGPLEYWTLLMVADNYSLNLNYKSRTSSSLQYNNEHALLLMKISIQMNEIIPLLCHFMFMKKVQNSNDFLFEIYDRLIDGYDIDIYSKLYETAYSNVMRSVKRNPIIWNKQDIRGVDPSTHATQCVQNILINIICKYQFSQNLIHFNYNSILRNTGFQITDIEYEYTFVSLSSSKRDEDMN